MSKTDSSIPGWIEASDQVTTSSVSRLKRRLFSGRQWLRDLLLRLNNWAAVVQLAGGGTWLPGSRSGRGLRSRWTPPRERLERTQDSGLW